MIPLLLSTALAQGAPSSAFRFGGQYRINTFAESSAGDGPTALGERIRLRPTGWMDLGRTRAMLQLEANQVDNAFAFRARYADASVAFGRVRVHLGLLPLSDRFGDTLFSASWDFNPLAVSVESDEGSTTGRVAFGLVQQGLDPVHVQDDVACFTADLDRGGYGVSLVSLYSGVGAAVAPGELLVLPGARYTRTIGSTTVGLGVLGSGLAVLEGPAASLCGRSAPPRGSAPRSRWAAESCPCSASTRREADFPPTGSGTPS